MSRFAQIVWLVSSFICGTVFAEGEIRWAPDLATARRAAAQFQVPLLVHFYGDNCLPCKTLEQRVLNQDSVVKTLNKYFICVRVNASQERAIAIEYQVHSWPTDVFVSPDGQILFQGISKQDVSGYMETLQSVAVMNRDRNTMLAADRAKQSELQQNQTASVAQASTNNAVAASLPPASTTSAAPPAIASSTPAAQFQVSPPARPAMMDSQAGLPPLPAHLASKPLGSNSAGSNPPGSNAMGSNGVAKQMNSQANMPIVVSNTAVNSQSAPPTTKLASTGSTGSVVSNPYYQNSEAMVCGPDGKCGPVASNAGNNSMNATTNVSPSSTAQFPSLAGTTANPNATVPTFQPKSTMLVSATTGVTNSNSPSTQLSTIGLIETKPAEASEVAAYNGYCPIALVTTGQKVQGTTSNSVRHRGRTYLMQSPEAVKQFMQAPDRYSPILSGYDPMIFLESGELVDGTLEHALHDPVSGTVVLFANADSLNKFKADPARNAKALSYILSAANKK